MDTISVFLFILIFVGMIYMNGKLNVLLDRSKPQEQKPTPHPRTPEPAVPPTVSSMAAAFSAAAPTAVSSPVSVPKPPATVAPSAATVAVPKPPEKADGEEAGSRWLGKIGVLAIVLGVSFFLKWSFDNNIIGPVGRVLLGFLGGAAMVGIGQYLRKKYLVYSDIITGGGIAILYLTIFAAYAFYGFVGLPVAMILMLAVTALAVALSVIGGTAHLAVLGVLGGLLTPFLIRGAEMSYLTLFSYLLVLDLGILGVAIFKKWNGLNVLGFVGTALHFSVWLGAFYRPEVLWPVFFFLTAFFLVYLIAGIIHNVLWGKNSTGVELALVTLNAAAYGIMSYLLLYDTYRHNVGIFMFALSLLYFAVAYVAYRMNKADTVLNTYLPGIAIIFFTLAIPIYFNGSTITLAWLLESALLAAAGSLSRRHAMNALSVGVYAIGLTRLLMFDTHIDDLTSFTPVFNERFMLVVAAVIVAYIIGFMLRRHLGEGDEDGRKEAAAAFFIVANVLSLSMLTVEIHTHAEKSLLAVSRIERAAMESIPLPVGFERYGDKDANKVRSIQNRRNTLVSVTWALYATVLSAVGFAFRRRLLRLLGLILLFVTAFKVLVDVWQLGPLYRIISSISFGVIALLVSFAYARWKDRLKEVF